MTQYIRFTKTSKNDVTVGKLYMIDTDDDGMHHFEDDDGALRSVKRNGKLNKFMIIDVDDVFAEAYNSTFDEVSEDEIDDVLAAIESLQEQGPDMDDEDTLYIVFSDTTKRDVTLGKLYAITSESAGGYTFLDDAGDERYVYKLDDLSTFEIVDENGATCEDMLKAAIERVEEFIEDNSPQPDGAVYIDYIDGYVAHLHGVVSFDIEERGRVTLVVITDTEGGITLIPFDRVKKVRLLHMFDEGKL